MRWCHQLRRIIVAANEGAIGALIVKEGPWLHSSTPQATE